MSRLRLCNNKDWLKCTKEHNGLELTIVFDNKKNRDRIFNVVKEILSKNLSDDIVDRLDLIKTSGELQNCHQEIFGIHSVNVDVNGNKDGFTKPLLEGVDP